MSDPRYFLDSNICIYILNGNAPRLRDRVEEQVSGSVAVSAICYAEVMKGISERDDMLSGRAEKLFAIVPVVPFDQAAADCYRRLPFRRNGFDRLIAAHALALGVTLVTNNEADFADISDLRIENWMQ